VCYGLGVSVLFSPLFSVGAGGTPRWVAPMPAARNNLPHPLPQQRTYAGARGHPPADIRLRLPLGAVSLFALGHPPRCSRSRAMGRYAASLPSRHLRLVGYLAFELTRAIAGDPQRRSCTYAPHSPLPQQFTPPLVIYGWFTPAEHQRESASAPRNPLRPPVAMILTFAFAFPPEKRGSKALVLWLLVMLGCPHCT